MVVKIPRFDFAKFPRTDKTLGTMMKSVGEVMAIGRTFKEAINKAIRSLEQDAYGIAFPDYSSLEDEEIKRAIRTPNPNRLWYIASAFRKGYSLQEVYELSKIDPWFLENIRQIVEFESLLKGGNLTPEVLRMAKEMGYSDVEIGKLTGMREEEIKELRQKWSIIPAFKGVDTCAGEFVAYTPYYYSSYERPYYTLEEGELLDQD